jgi:hypothetical protein
VSLILSILYVHFFGGRHAIGTDSKGHGPTFIDSAGLAAAVGELDVVGMNAYRQDMFSPNLIIGHYSGHYLCQVSKNHHFIRCQCPITQ